MDTHFFKEQAQGQGAALAALLIRRVQLPGSHPHRQAPMGPLSSPHCHHLLHPLQAPWMKATCRMGRNAMKKRWRFPSLHLPRTSEYAAVSAGTFNISDQTASTNAFTSFTDTHRMIVDNCKFTSDLAAVWPTSHNNYKSDNNFSKGSCTHSVDVWTSTWSIHRCLETGVMG